MDYIERTSNPLKNITKSGTYKLRLMKPAFDKIRHEVDPSDGLTYTSARLLLVADDGSCLSKWYGTKYPKALALLIGKLSGKYAEEIRGDANPTEYMEYIRPALYVETEIGVTVEETVGRDGKTYQKYKLAFPRGSQKPAAPRADLPEANPPF